MQPVVVMNAARRVIGRKRNGRRLACFSFYKKWRVLVNAWRSTSSSTALRDFLDFTKNGAYPDRDPICISRKDDGHQRVNWKIGREGEPFR
jgi:hypothetical protein